MILKQKKLKKFKHREIMWMSLCLACFIFGLWVGFVLHEQFMFNGLTQIAKGLEGTTFNLEIDFNETEIVNTLVKIFNQTDASQM